MERLVTIPLEVTLAGMPGLNTMRSKSLFGLSDLRNQFEYGVDYWAARQEVINRLQFAQNLPQGVCRRSRRRARPARSTATRWPRPRTPPGRDIYTLNDLKALQDWTLEREFRRVPRIADITSFGGTVKRYEIHPDPDRLRRYGITLAAIAERRGQLQRQRRRRLPVPGPHRAERAEHRPDRRRPGPDAVEAAVRRPRTRRRRPSSSAAKRTAGCAKSARSSWPRSTTSPIKVDDLVDGGPLARPEEIGSQGVVVGHQTRLGKVGVCRPEQRRQGPRAARTPTATSQWIDEDDKVQSIVLLRQHEESLPALHDVKEKVKELNENPGQLLPGVKIEPYYDRTELIDVTTETVRENLLLGIVLVVPCC